MRTGAGWANRKVSRWGTIVAIAPIVSSLAIGCSSDTTESDGSSSEGDVRAAFDTWIESVQSGDLDRFKSVVCADTFEKGYAETSGPEFESSARDAVDVAGLYVVDWYDTVTVNGDTAEVTVTGHREGLREQSESIDEERKTAGLVVEDGAWKVCSEPQDDAATMRRRELAAAKSDVQDAVEAFYAGIASGSVSDVGAASCATLERIIRTQNYTVAELAADLGENLVSFDDTVVNGDTAKVHVTAETADELFSLVYALENNGTWLVCSPGLLASTTKTER
ncbi:hypothetical protein [Antrihabitans sp. YC2-6]|uniref:Rv0361 family membrane protein n=1 Tax=Antrihabitans sp. YC2-6 TaxID=2799498 RepID=UPI0018F73736|nr:hypothetical protein [Antrihabitans sp. YC2-6]MBJ8345119.1 hypothetical protein [Antrihabitans sp. YC2-6]